MPLRVAWAFATDWFKRLLLVPDGAAGSGPNVVTAGVGVGVGVGAGFAIEGDWGGGG